MPHHRPPPSPNTHNKEGAEPPSPQKRILDGGQSERQFISVNDYPAIRPRGSSSLLFCAAMSRSLPCAFRLLPNNSRASAPIAASVCHLRVFSFRRPFMPFLASCSRDDFWQLNAMAHHLGTHLKRFIPFSSSLDRPRAAGLHGAHPWPIIPAAMEPEAVALAS